MLREDKTHQVNEAVCYSHV